MSNHIQRLLATLSVLALLASACRVDSASELAEPVQDLDSATPVEPTAVPPTAVPATDDGDDAEPVAEDPQTGGTVFDGVAPAGSLTPASWDETLPLDPAVFQGVLPNGMKYLIRGNDRPGSQAQLRLVVHAGSLNETPGTEGSAHFLEHMMFNGTERFPNNEIVQILEGFGSGFGPDVNAYTSFEETVYELQVPTRTTVTLQLGLEVLFEWATAALIDEQAVFDERGVVREEHRRSAEQLSGRLGEETRSVLLAGTPYLNREPIGDAEVIDAMTSDTLREYYERWYRPELMTVIAVGDFDPADVERRIIATFVQEPSAEPTKPFDLGDESGPLPEPVFDVITDPEIQRPEVEVLWRLGDQPTVNQSGLRSDLIGSVAFSMLNTRLFERLQTGETAFLSANAGAGGYTSTTKIASMSARSAAGDLDVSLRELLTEVERARQFGFTNLELERSLGSVQASIDQAFLESNTRQDESYAGELVGYSLNRGVLVGSDAQRDIGVEVLESITVEDIQRFLFDVLAVDPYVLVTAPASDESLVPTPEALAAAYDDVVGVAVEEQVRSVNDQTELMQRPEPAEIAQDQYLPGLDTTIITYENGARLAFRQTEITENIVQMIATSPGGYFAVDGPEAALVDQVPGLIAGSGFESVDIVTVDRLLADSIASLNAYIGRAEEGLSGQASTNDIEVMMQLAHLTMTEPIVTDLQVRQFDERWRPLVADPTIRPETAGNLELWRLRYGDSPWFRYIPTMADLDELDQDVLLDVYRERFANAGDFVFVVVGDFDPDELIDLGARYLGTLPDAGVRETAVDRDPGLPEENLEATVRAGIGDQGSVRINWESPYPFTLDAAVAAQALELVVNARLRDLIREELSASYAPRASVSVLAEPKPWIDTIVEVESDPERVGEVSDAVRGELERIRNGDFEQQYLDLAVEQLVDDYQFFSNRNWLDLISFHLAYPDRPAGEYRDRSQIASGLSIADIAEAAALAFPPTRSVEIRLIPAG